MLFASYCNENWDFPCYETRKNQEKYFKFFIIGAGSPFSKMMLICYLAIAAHC
jgi:hypothetical protein